MLPDRSAAQPPVDGLTDGAQRSREERQSRPDVCSLSRPLEDVRLQAVPEQTLQRPKLLDQVTVSATRGALLGHVDGLCNVLRAMRPCWRDRGRRCGAKAVPEIRIRPAPLFLLRRLDVFDRVFVGVVLLDNGVRSVEGVCRSAV